MTVAAPKNTRTKLTPREGEEIWQVNIQGTVYLGVTGHNQFGQPMIMDKQLGPQKLGLQFRITTFDRVMNQQKVVDGHNDPFLNGMLVRCDKSQQADEDTASDQAVSGTDLGLMFDKSGVVFQQAVQPLNEVNLRRLLDLGEALDASRSQLDYLDELVRERYGKGSPQDLEVAHRMS